MTGNRKTALVAGLLYLITFVSSIPALFILSPVLNHADYIISSGADTRIVWGCLLDLVNALAAIGTAVALFPVVKRQNEGLALGFVMSRMLEAAVILIGIVSLLAIVTLRQNPAGADPATLLATGHSLVAVRDWTFLLGPGLMPAFNALLLGTLMYRSRLVPRFIPLMGLLGAPLLLVADLLTLFGHNTQTSAVSFLLTLPVAVWELSVGLYLTVKGFRPAAILPGPVTTSAPDRPLATIA